MLSHLLRAPLAWLVVAALAAGAVVGLYWFQPWKLITDREVSESLSSVGPTPAASSSSAPAVSASDGSAAPAPNGPVVIRNGAFVTHEHPTTGTARIVRLADGSYRLELVALDTSNGPDLRVWLTDQPVREGTPGWRVFDDGEWVELGRLKGNRGDQAYAIPAGADPARFTSVSIWCRRFAVSFGAAPLMPA
jgi:hypothetical protein